MLSSLFRAVWINIPGLVFVVTLCTLDGLVIFAVYAGCDLGEQGIITSNDQVRASVNKTNAFTASGGRSFAVIDLSPHTTM